MKGRLLTRAQAQDLIDSISLRIDGKKASAKTVSAKPFAECADRDWWLDNGNLIDVNSPRSRALLTAYVELGGEEFPMTGIPLADGYLRPDRAVIRSLAKSGMITMSDGKICMTSEGRALISGQRTDSAESIALQPGTEADGVAFGRAGEGENHRALRLWVQQNSAAIFPKLQNVSAQTEYILPSADRIDVVYDAAGLRIAIEVKSRDSNDADLARGIYQCVKYRAVLQAITIDQAVEVCAVLVTELPLPTSLQKEANRLAIQNIVVGCDRRI